MPLSSKSGSRLADAAWRDLENMVQCGDLRGFQRLCCLLEAGARDPAAKNWGPLEHAVFHSQPEMVSWWIGEYGADRATWATPHLLHIAIRAKCCENTLELLWEGGCPLESADELGKTPLHQAAWVGNEVATLFLLRAAADPNSRDHTGWTPLRWAIRGDHEVVARHLLAFGADPFSTCHSEISDADFAVVSGHEAMAAMFRPFAEHRLLSRGVFPEQEGELAVRRL